MISMAANGSTTSASAIAPVESSPHNSYQLRTFLSAFSRSNFDECLRHFRASEEPLINFVRLLPIDAIIARFPATRQLLEAIYFRLTISPSVLDLQRGGLSKDDIRVLHCSTAVKEVINYIADAQERNEDERAKSHCYALLTSIARLDPSCVAKLRRYYCLLENSTATLGENVMTCSPGNRPTVIWDALGSKLENLRKSSKLCLDKLKPGGGQQQATSSKSSSSLFSSLLNSNNKTTTTTPPHSSPILVGDLRLIDVEDRLMLAAAACPQLDEIVSSDIPVIRNLHLQMKARMDADKRLLVLVNELKPRSRTSTWTTSPMQSGVGVEKSASQRMKMADLLYRYKRAVGQALEWINPGCLESLSSAESMISLSITVDSCDNIDSKTPPLVSPPQNKAAEAVKNGKDSVLSSGGSSTSNSPSESVENQDYANLANIESNRTPLKKEVLTKSNRIENSSKDVEEEEDYTLGDLRPSVLIERFTSLYTNQRMQLLQAMDDLEELNNLEALKARLILSVVVVSFRQCSAKVVKIRQQALSLAGFNSVDLPLASEFMKTFSVTLKRSCGSYPLDDMRKTVTTLVLEALNSFPRLSKLKLLHSFIDETLRVAWCLSVQQPPFIISHSASQFDSRQHERFYVSSTDSNDIKAYIWPALCLGSESGPIICKAVVET